MRLQMFYTLMKKRKRFVELLHLMRFLGSAASSDAVTQTDLQFVISVQVSLTPSLIPSQPIVTVSGYPN